MTETPDAPLTPEPADDAEGGVEQADRRPDDTTPRGNPPVDDDAVEKGRDNLERVKPY
jgi:hypothetical protein